MEINTNQMFKEFLALAGTYYIVAIVVAVLTIIAWWKLFTKAGEAGWKSIVPVLNGHTLYKIAWKPIYFWLIAIMTVAAYVVPTFFKDNLIVAYVALAVLVVVAIMHIVLSFKLAKAYGKGFLFGLGLAILHPIFVLILAFGKAQYTRRRG